MHACVSGWVSRSLLHLSFQIRKAYSDIMIKNRQVVPLWVCPSIEQTFRRGRAMTVVMLGSVGHGMFLHRHISLATFQMILLWFALQLNRICCMVSGTLHVWQSPLSLYLSIFSQ